MSCLLFPLWYETCALAVERLEQLIVLRTKSEQGLWCTTGRPLLVLILLPQSSVSLNLFSKLQDARQSHIINEMRDFLVDILLPYGEWAFSVQ
jgi:hypothetical protein